MHGKITSNAIFLLFFACLCIFRTLHHSVFWDAQVYARALDSFRHGVNPYLKDSHTRFVYPPAFLMLTPRLGRFGWIVYLVLNIAATVSIPFLIAALLRKTWIAPIAVLIFALTPAYASEMSLLSGNIANLLYAAILSAGLLGIRKGKWFPFHAAVIFASAIKPPFLAFLLLPLLITGAWISTLVSILAVTAAFFVQRLAMPALFSTFQESVHSQLVTHGSWGIGPASYFHGSRFSLVPQAVIVGIATVYLWHCRKAWKNSELWISSILIACIVANPRILAYDVIVAMIPAIYVVVEAIREWVASPAVVGVALSAFILILDRNADIGTFALLFSALSLSLLLFHRHSAAAHQGDPEFIMSMPQ